MDCWWIRWGIWICIASRCCDAGKNAEYWTSTKLPSWKSTIANIWYLWMSIRNIWRISAIHIVFTLISVSFISHETYIDCCFDTDADPWTHFQSNKRRGPSHRPLPILKYQLGQMSWTSKASLTRYKCWELTVILIFILKAKRSCLLCKRQFPSTETLEKHIQLSTLHKVLYLISMHSKTKLAGKPRRKAPVHTTRIRRSRIILNSEIQRPSKGASRSAWIRS